MVLSLITTWTSRHQSPALRNTPGKFFLHSTQQDVLVLCEKIASTLSSGTVVENGTRITRDNKSQSPTRLL